MCAPAESQATSISAAKNWRSGFKLAQSFRSNAVPVKVFPGIAALTGGTGRPSLRGMRPRFLPLLLVLAAWPLAQVLYPGCATLLSGTTQQIRVKSKPAAARVLVNGNEVGVTPVTTRVSRWGFHRVRIELAGYEPYEVRLEKRYNSNASGNVVIGGVWIVVDAVTGAIFDLDVSADARRELLKNQWEKGDPGFSQAINFAPPLIITAGLRPLGPARQIGQMTKR